MLVIMAMKSYEPCFTRSTGARQYTTCRGAQKKRAKKSKAKAKSKKKMILPSRKTVSASKSKNRRKQIGLRRVT